MYINNKPRKSLVKTNKKLILTKTLEKMTPEEIQAAMDKKLKSATDSIKALTTKSEADNQLLQDALDKQSEAIQDMVEAMNKRQLESVSLQFQKFLEKNVDRLKSIKTQGHGNIEFTPDMLKAVGDVSTSSGGDVGTPPPNHNTSLGNFNYRNDAALIGLCSVTSTNQASFPYTELTPKEGGFGFVAEGAEKPQIDFKWEVRYSTPKKIAAYEILTEEVADDIARLVSTAKTFLKTRHDLFKADKIYFGTGVGEEVKGATVYARTFAAGGMATAVESPNFMDVINACITDIYTTHNYVDESSYQPNVVLVNPVDFFLNLVSAKDANGSPLYPTASLFNELRIGGVMVKPWAKIPAGKIFVADMAKYNVANYIPYTIRVGWINDQMITNKFTMVGESRFHAYVKNLDEQAFIYDDIATVKAAITKP